MASPRRLHSGAGAGEGGACGSRISLDRHGAASVYCSSDGSALTRSLAVLEATATRLERTDDIDGELSDLNPAPLVSATYRGADLSGWPNSAEGRQIAGECEEVFLFAYQLGRQRNTLGILICRNEVFVVWLAVEVTAAARNDGFVDDEDAALALPRLKSQLGRLIDLTWLEEE